MLYFLLYRWANGLRKVFYPGLPRRMRLFKPLRLPPRLSEWGLNQRRKGFG